MNQKDYEILVTNMINTMAKRIFELVSQGYTKGQIIDPDHYPVFNFS